MFNFTESHTYRSLHRIIGSHHLLSSTMTKNHGKKNTGFILLIVGAVIAGILALLDLVLGIITWILCGVSITQFRKLQGEQLESNLDFGAVAELKKSW